MKGWWCAVSFCVIGLGLICHADVAQAGVEDLLYEKGQITQEEWVKLKADHEKVKEEAIGQQRSALKNWFEQIGIRGYTQFRYSCLTGEKNLRLDDSDASFGNNTCFSIRRARLQEPVSQGLPHS